MAEEAAVAAVCPPSPIGKGKDLMEGAKKMISSNYDRDKEHWIKFLIADTASPNPPGGWMVETNKSSFPEINDKLVTRFAAYLLDNYNKGTMDNCRAAINHFYLEADLGVPWEGRAFKRTMVKYKEQRKKLAIKKGQHNMPGAPPSGCRVPIPEDSIQWLLNYAEGLENPDPRKSRSTLILMGYLFLLRASSLAFKPGDISFVRDRDLRPTALVVNSYVKCMDKATPHQLRSVAPDRAFGTRHPRARIFDLVEKCLVHGDLFCIKTPESANKLISTWIQDLIPDEVTRLVEGHKISSHSLRKAGASALVKMGACLLTRVMPWGRWKTVGSAEKYADKSYVATSFSGGVFDWLLPMGNPFRWNQGSACYA